VHSSVLPSIQDAESIKPARYEASPFSLDHP
jgi:hypothetical protein